MGDVFEAMNRARRERGQQQSPPPASAAEEDTAPLAGDGTPESGGLSFGDVEAEALVEELKKEERKLDERHEEARDNASRASHASPVAAAASRARAEAQTEYDNRLDVDEPSNLPASHSKLNGYSSEVVVHHDRGSAVTEQYRAIRTQLLARARNRPIQTTVITSSTPEEGKSVTTANLGIVFSELRNHKTLLIEGDLRRPSFNKLFDRECTPGMLQLLRGDVTKLDDAVHKTIYENLQFIPAGGRDSTHSTELLTSPRMIQILDQVKDRYDHIFIDSPPVVTVTDSCILGAMADQVLLVVRLNKTPSGAVERAKRLLRASNCEVSGVILTHLKHYISRYLYKYSYGYGYGYGYAGAK
ncbi:MAG: CpsD/CapB family tyrosine-protein kinase [Phycisphaeraceae bacterium]